MNNKRMMQALCLAIAAVWLTAGMAAGQTGTSRVTGMVTDPQSAVVVGAKVTVVHEGTGVEYKSETTDAGTFVFDALPPASYTVKVEMSGFKTFISRKNILTVGTPLTVNVKLELGDAATVVEVAETYERVQTATSGNTGAVVDQRTLTDLPLGLETGTGGRNPLIFIRLQPGVNTGANTGGGSHVNGARDRAFNYTLDGIDINESSAGGSEFSPLRTNPDSLQEFRVITSNATAEYGRNSGAQVELTTRSGTNEIHGTLFYFHRNSALSANEWFNNQRGVNAQGALISPRPFLLQHQYGGSVGGPILKNRTFYFFNFQGQRQTSPFTRTRTVYTQAARQGSFRWRVGAQNGNAASTNPSVDSQGNPLFPACAPPSVLTNCIASYNIGTSDPRALGLDSTIQGDWIGKTPVPNDFSAGDGLNTAGFTFSGGRKDPQRDFVFKIDHKFNDSNLLFVRYAWGRQDTVNDTTNDGEPPFPGLPPTVNTERKPRNLAVNYRRVLSPRLVNELVVGGNHFTFDFVVPTAGDVLPFDLSNVTDPLLNARGNLRTINTYQVVDNLSYHRGAHAIRGGINFRYQQHRDVRGSVGGENSELLLNFAQTVVATCATGSFGTGTVGVVGGQERFCLPGTTAGSFLVINSTDRSRLQQSINELLGRIGSIRRGFVAENDLQAFQEAGARFINDARYPEYDFYIQDNWRLKPNLTVDLGLRWEFKLRPRNPDNRIFHPDEPVVLGAPASTNLEWVRGQLYGSDNNNLSPSIGFAWDPFKKGKTSIRGNYRLAFDRINTFVISSQIYNTVPGLATGVINLTFGQNGGPGGTGGRWRDGIPALAPTGTPQANTLPVNPAGIPFGTGTIAVVDPNFRAPKTNMWQLSVQHELWNGIVVDVSYLGRRANGLFGAYDVNQVEIFSNNFLNEFRIVQAGGQSTLINQIYGPDTRRTSGQTGSDFVRSQFPSSVLNGSVASVAADAASRVQNNIPLLQLAGLPLTFFRSFPQFGVVRVIDSNDFSTYHALQLVVSRKFVRNLSFQGSYTFSKSLDTRSFDPTFSVVSTGAVQSASSTPFDLRNRRLNYARSDFDRTHILIGYALWDLPFGTGQRFAGPENGFFSRLIGGWQVNGILTVETGRPFTVYSGFSQLSNIVNSPANCTGCPRGMGGVRSNDPAFAGFPSYFTAEERAQFSQPGPGTLGNTGRNFFTSPGFFNIDMAILKRTAIKERMNLELRFEFFNLTNSPSFGLPSSVIPPTGGTSSSFGRISGTTSEARKIRVGAKFNF